MKPTLQALPGPGESASLASLAPPQALEGPEEEPLWHVPFPEASSPGPGRAWRGGFMVFLFDALCYTICTIKAPPRPFQGRGGASMAFKLAKVLDNSHAPHGSGLALINCIVADHSHSSWERTHAYEDSVLCSIHHEGEWPGTLFYAICRRMFNP